MTDVTAETNPAKDIPPAALRVKQGAPYIGVSVPTFWRFAKTDPTFPKPIKIGNNTTVFLRSELDTWLAAKRNTAAPNTVKQPAAQEKPKKARRAVKW